MANVLYYFNWYLIKKFTNTYEFFNGDINKFILLLREGVNLYEYMDICERFNETSLPKRKCFHSNLKKWYYRCWLYLCKKNKELKIKNLSKCHDLYVQCNTSLLEDEFLNFRNKCIEIYDLDPVHFLWAPGLAWLACLKKQNQN